MCLYGKYTGYLPSYLWKMSKVLPFRRYGHCSKMRDCSRVDKDALDVRKIKTMPTPNCTAVSACESRRKDRQTEDEKDDVHRCGMLSSDDR